MLVSLAKLGSPALVGQYALALAVVGPVALFFTLQLRSVLATDLCGEFEFRDYWFLRLLTTGSMFAVVGAIAYWGNYKRDTVLTIFAVALCKAVEAVSDILYGLLQRQVRMDCISRSMIVRGVLCFATFTVVLYLSGRAYWATAWYALVSGGIVLIYDIPVTLRAMAGSEWSATERPVTLRPSFEKARVLRLLSSSGTLGTVIMLISLHTNIPRYIIERRFGETELGVFSALAYFTVAGNVIVEALGQSVMPHLAAIYQKGQTARFRELLVSLMLGGATLGGAGLFVSWLAGHQLLTVLYGFEYARHMDVFLILMAAGIPTYAASFLGHGLMAARQFRIQLPLSLLSSSSMLIACLWLVPIHGARGAAEATLVMSVVRVVASAAVMIRVMNHLAASSYTLPVPARAAVIVRAKIATDAD